VQILGVRFQFWPLVDELRNVYLNHPVFAGDTVSHNTANALYLMGLTRQTCRGWVPTTLGQYVGVFADPLMRAREMWCQVRGTLRMVR
jgi:hypothetical protein